MKWERLSRDIKYQTPYLAVYEDTVKLPNGHVIDDFSVVSVKDGVVIVATDENDNLIIVKEYKYGIDKEIFALPAGGFEDGGTPEKTAHKELLEETGYSGGNAEVVATYHDYPSKMTHTTYVVRMKNVRKTAKTTHEITESITGVACVPQSEVSSSTFVISVNVAALAACGII